MVHNACNLQLSKSETRIKQQDCFQRVPFSVLFFLNLEFSHFPTCPHSTYLFYQEKILSVDQYMAKGFERRLR